MWWFLVLPPKNVPKRPQTVLPVIPYVFFLDLWKCWFGPITSIFGIVFFWTPPQFTALGVAGGRYGDWSHIQMVKIRFSGFTGFLPCNKWATKKTLFHYTGCLIDLNRDPCNGLWNNPIPYQKILNNKTGCPSFHETQVINVLYHSLQFFSQTQILGCHTFSNRLEMNSTSEGDPSHLSMEAGTPKMPPLKKIKGILAAPQSYPPPQEIRA